MSDPLFHAPERVRLTIDGLRLIGYQRWITCLNRCRLSSSEFSTLVLHGPDLVEKQ